MRRYRNAVSLAVAAGLALAAFPALAHKLKLFATARGPEISGYAYFSGGDRARGAALTVTAPDGTVLFAGATGDDGTFRFTAARRVDHVLAVDSGDGHQTRITLAADTLPSSLPGGAGEGGSVAAAAAPVPAPMAAPASLPSAELQAMIEEAVARQVRPLREQLDAYQDQVRWHDVAGGIGTIIGLAGLAFGLTRGRKGRRS